LQKTARTFNQSQNAVQRARMRCKVNTALTVPGPRRWFGYQPGLWRHLYAVWLFCDN